MFLPTILIPVCSSSSPAFHMLYSAYKLNKQGDNMQGHGGLEPAEEWSQECSLHLSTLLLSACLSS